MNEELSAAELAILSLLGEAPRHGYEIETLIEQRGLSEWTEIGFSSIYFLLDRLTKRGLAEALPGGKGGKSRKQIGITNAGQIRLAEESFRAVAHPNRTYPQLMLGMANWPLIEGAKGIEALTVRATMLRAETARVQSARAAQQPLPHFVEAMFDYAAGQLAADLQWTEKLLKETKMLGEKIDFKAAHKALYHPPAGRFVEIDVPVFQFVKVDGAGDPNSAAAYKSAVEWLYSVSYALKFAAKAALGKDYVVPPLEGLWWADDPKSFVTRAKHDWRWTMMIMAPGFINAAMLVTAVAKAGKKLGNPPESLRLESYDEGRSLQTLHVGSYDDEGPTLARLHDEFMPAQNLGFNGPHHEIYLSDPRKTEPAKLKTILRQPVKRN